MQAVGSCYSSPSLLPSFPPSLPQYQDYLALRPAFRQRPDPANYTIMVHHIPGAMRSNTAVSSYFNALFPHSVQKVTIMLELPELEALIDRRDQVLVAYIYVLSTRLPINPLYTAICVYTYI